MATLVQASNSQTGAGSQHGISMADEPTIGNLLIAVVWRRQETATKPTDDQGGWHEVETLYCHIGTLAPAVVYTRIVDGSESTASGPDWHVGLWGNCERLMMAEFAGPGSEIPTAITGPSSWANLGGGGGTVNARQSVATDDLAVMVFSGKTFGANTMSGVSPSTVAIAVGDTDYTDMMVYRTGSGSLENGVDWTAGQDGGYEYVSMAFGEGSPPELDCAFSADPTSGFAPLSVDFTDESTGDPDGWLWDFGDGDTSTAQNPTHVYAIAGTYSVTLTVTRSEDDADCTDTQVDVIQVGDPVGWDVYAAADPNGPRLATVQRPELDRADPMYGATARSIRVALDETGEGGFELNRYSDVATSEILAAGNIVKCRFPWRDDYDAAFIIERPESMLAATEEKGGEKITLGGRGLLAYLERAIMDAVAYTTGTEEVDRLVQIWRTNNVPKPVGVAYAPDTPDYVWVLSATRRRIYKVRQSDRKVVHITKALWSGDTNYAGGLTRDPADSDYFWALEAPWALGGSGDTKIRKIRRSDWNVVDTFNLGSAQISDIRANATHLWTTQYATGAIQKRSKTTGNIVDTYTVTWKGDAQENPNGIAISDNGTGSEIAMWFGGTGSGGVSRALVADISDPSDVTRTIRTEDIAAFGGDWSSESGSDYLYMVSYTLGLVWKYQLTTSIPIDPRDGVWRLNEDTPGAILWRIMQEAQSDREDHPQPLPDLSYVFTADDASDAAAWAGHDGTKEFEASVGEPVLEPVLRLLLYNLVVQMSPYLVLGGWNRSTYGTDRTSTTFAAGKVRLERGVNVIPELARQEREPYIHSNMLATGRGGRYERGEIDDLGYIREGAIDTDLKNRLALQGTADATLDRERLEDADGRIRLTIPIPRPGEADEATGLYHPWTHYNVGDLVTLHTGSGTKDFTNKALVLYAFTLTEGPAGTWETAVLELAAPTKKSRRRSLLDRFREIRRSRTGTSGGVTVTGDDTEAVGSTISIVGGQVYQIGEDAVGIVVDGIRRLLGLDDVNAEDIADGQGIAYDAVAGEFVPSSFAAGIPRLPVYPMPFLMGEDGEPGEPGMPGTAGTGGTGDGDGGDGETLLQPALLGVTAYNPTSGATYTTTTTLTALDGTNGVVAFVAPPSGAVIVDVACQNYPNGSGSRSLRFGILDGGGATVGEAIQVRGEDSSVTPVDRSVAQFKITGLTPGTAYTFKLAASHSGAGAYVVRWGDTAAGGFGPLYMAVWDAAPQVVDGVRILRGRVNADGTIAGGTGFTVSKTGTGVYDVTFTVAFSAAPVVLASIARTGSTVASRAIHVYDAATGSVTIKTRGVSPDDPIDSEFTFVAVEPNTGADGLPLAVAKQTLTGGNQTTTSTTFVDVPNASQSITTGPRRVLVTASIFVKDSTQYEAVYFDIEIDGTRVGGADGIQRLTEPSGLGGLSTITIAFETDALSAGAHTIKLKWRVSAGTGTVGQASGQPLIWTIQEIADVVGDVLATPLPIGYAEVLTDQQRASGATSYADLATVGPTVTIDVNTSVKVTIGTDMYTDGTGAPRMSFAMSGANTLAAGDERTEVSDWMTTADNISGSSRVCVLTGLTPGSTVFTAKYAHYPSGINANFRSRTMLVERLD